MICPGTDEPLLTYEGAGLTDKRYLHADERGSIIAFSNASGQVIQINAYDDYGIPQGKSPAGVVISGGTDTTTVNFGRFGYTGQVWLPEVGLYHYKARAYSPTLGRFMQTDPIGYEDGVNLYAYVGGDPINLVDPTGLAGMRPTGDKAPVRTEPIDCPPALFVACPQGRREREQGRSEGSVGFSRGDAVGRERGAESGGGGRGGAPAPPAPEAEPSKVKKFLCSSVASGLAGEAAGGLTGLAVKGLVDFGVKASNARAAVIGAQLGARTGRFFGVAGVVIGVAIGVGVNVAVDKAQEKFCKDK